MTIRLSAFPHIWDGPGTDAPVLLALHGRGGGEGDLVPAAHVIGPGHGVLAPRGPEPQPPGWAWFAHRAIGVPVEASFDARLAELAAWIETAAAAYGIRLPMAALGFSNGGMMAGALVAVRPDLVDRAMLMASGYPLPPHLTDAGISGGRLLICGGTDDPFHTTEMMDAGVRAYGAAGAQVEARRYPGVGHTITGEQADDAAAWLAGTAADDAGGALAAPPA
jgi:phospholipase/carboxylesterase